MKQRPILFQGAMVRALLAGTKTQTRRIVKPQPIPDARFVGGWKVVGKGGEESATCSPLIADKSPYGQPGDQLWVREAWRTSKVADELKPSLLVGGGYSPIWYEAQDELPFHPSEFGKLRPSMFMPRWAGRITLEITSVRVERLQDISEADARAEGITDGGCLNCGNPEPCGCAHPAPDARDSYCNLWGQINGPDSWAANPWVWVVSFRAINVKGSK